jgi:hypothetical protein
MHFSKKTLIFPILFLLYILLLKTSFAETEYQFLLAIGSLILILYIFIRLSLRIRKSGGSMITIMHGSLDGFYNRETKKAVEMVAEKKANKKLDEQTSGEPGLKNTLSQK